MNFSVKTTSIEQCKSHCVVIGVYANEKSKKANSNMVSIDVRTGSLCLFPSSLLHYTIPFEADEDRIVLAFDVVPNKKAWSL